jgi:hypothetical protein
MKPTFPPSKLQTGKLLLSVLLGVLLLSAAFLLDLIDLIIKLGIGVLMVLIHQVCISALASKENRVDVPAKLDSASVNSISSLFCQLGSLS